MVRVRRVLRSPVFWLAVVAVAFTATQLALLPLRTFYSWDETIYASRFSTLVAPTPPSPHRAPGMALVLAPVTVFTASFVVIRGYLTVLSAVALFFAYRAWVGVDGRVAVLGALLFAALGETLLIAHLALPNYASAVAAVATTGFFVRAGEADRDGGRPWATLAGVAGWLGAMALIRPSDAILLAVALALGLLLARRWRRADLALAVLAGLVIGGIGWLVEAFTRFGGPAARLAAMRAVTEAGPPIVYGWLADLRATAAAYPSMVAATVLIAVLSAALLAIAVRRTHATPVRVWLVTLLAAGLVIVPYWFALSWSTPRYELPAQALLTVAGAAVLVRLASLPGRTVARVLATAVVAVLVLAYGWQQVGVGVEFSAAQYRSRETRRAWAAEMHAAGVRAPCVVTGAQAPAFAYALGCRAGDNISALPSRDNWGLEFTRDQARADREDAALVAVLRAEDAPAAVDGMRQVKLSGGYVAYLSSPAPRG